MVSPKMVHDELRGAPRQSLFVVRCKSWRQEPAKPERIEMRVTISLPRRRDVTSKAKRTGKSGPRGPGFQTIHPELFPELPAREKSSFGSRTGTRTPVVDERATFQADREGKQPSLRSPN